jgi:RHS repeat-associated protein
MIARTLKSISTIGLLCAGMAQGQENYITITPQTGYFNGQVEVTVTWCSFGTGTNGFWMTPGYYEIKVNGVDQTSQFSLEWNPSACGFTGDVSDEQFYVSVGTITVDMESGPVSVQANAWNGWSYMWSAVHTFMPPLPRRNITVTAGNQFVQALPSSARQERFTVRNAGNYRDSVRLDLQTCSVAASCTMSPANGTAVVLQPGQAQLVTVTYTSAAAPGSNGLIRVRAYSLKETGTRDSTWTDVTVEAAPPSGVVIVGSSPGVSGFLDRGLCVTVAVGEGAAMECGDLRLVHPLPSTRTLSRSRTPTLIYNSQHAHPRPLIQADVTLPTAWGSLPATVTACIRLQPANTTVGCMSWPGSQWGALGATRRVVAAGTDSTWSTGLYAFRIEITGGSGQSIVSAQSEFPVVNRSASIFGAGWWLAGLEELLQLADGRIMVTGGDGSVRVYSQVATDVYTAVNPSRADTLRYYPATGEFMRRLPGNVRVVFQGSGLRHVRTLDRVGNTTQFTWNTGTGCLTHVRLPTSVNTTTTKNYQLFCSSTPTRVDSARAPLTHAGAAARQVRLIRNGTRLISILGPDTTHVDFTHHATWTNLVTQRRDRRNHTTTFAYGSGRRLSGVTLPLVPAVTTILAPAENRGLDMAQPAESVFTAIQRPRSGLTDTTRFWINALGAPVRVRNAVGQETRIRYSATWGALPDSVIGPTRLGQRAYYSNTRGLLDSVIVHNPLGDGQRAKTSYQYHAAWPFVTQITTPTGLISQFGYSSSNGNRLWDQIGTSASRRTTYAYNVRGLPISIDAPEVPAEQIYYDTLGNVRRIVSPGGINTLLFGDLAGRDTMIISARGGLADSSGVYAWGVRSLSRYDIMDRLTRTDNTGPGVSVPIGRSLPADTVRIENHYDAGGNLTQTGRSHTNGGTWTSLDASQWEYDEIGRLMRERNGGAGWTTFTRDEAGNITATLTPRGLTVTVAFDPLGRQTRRVLPQVTISGSACGMAQWGVLCTWGHPFLEGAGLCFGADTAYFRYDAGGNLRRADNAWAQVRRGYAPGGFLTHDTLRIRNYLAPAPQPCGPGDRHSAAIIGDYPTYYAIRNTYDLEGRRTSLIYPSGQGTASFWYNGVTGVLDSLMGPGGDKTRFGFDLLNRLVTSTHPGNYVESRTYDNDSRLTGRLGDAYTRDASGRITLAATGTGTVEAFYTGLGALAYMSGHVNGGGGEEFQVDALGNRQWIWDDGLTETVAARKRVMIHDDAGRVASMSLGSCSPPCPYWYEYLYENYYDASGNSAGSVGYETRGTWPTHYRSYDERANYYGADELLGVSERVLVNSNTMAFEPGSVYEEYFYDALGRRVAVRSRQLPWCTPGQQCGSYFEHTVWDGAQIVFERRGGGRDSTTLESFPSGGTGESNQYGRVASVHAGGIDQPVQLLHNGGTLVVPHANWQGDYAYGTNASGQVCSGGNCPAAPWPGNQLTADAALSTGLTAPPTSWLGALITNKTDGSGLQYMRNRYYNPQTGQFTQQDPIGLAGGFNLYGFAAGDPVNFRDPFGLNADTTYVACRPVGGDNRDEEPASSYGHCAVRVADSRQGTDAMAEIVRVPGDQRWPLQTVRTFGTGSEEVARYGNRWVPVAVPAGMTEQEFDAAVVAQIYRQGREYSGQPYFPGGQLNSNSFVYRVITGAGGKVPAAASGHLARGAPGLCGGGGLRTGSNCSP